MTPTALVVHAHFYQPPRENPWTEEVPREPSAAPFHDWNERIAAECYRPNAFARVVGADGRVLIIVNNYELLSFNVGPTLMSWLERHRPEVYERIRAAQRARGGAIAQAWNHMILPLASERDARTQIRWGLADFRHRFGTEAPGLWLPETAVNDETLRILAEEGVGFTILAPTQARAVRPLPGTQSPGPAAVPNPEWQQVGPDGINPRIPYRWLHPADDGRGVDIVFYDGPLSHDLAFSTMPSEEIVERASAAGGKRGGLVAVALDGETFGHHQKWMDRGIAYALSSEAHRRGLEVANLAAWLARNRPAREVAVRESAWSCAHGVGRWATNCGCSTGGAPGSDQRWRAPLRAALDRLRDFGVEVFERRADLFLDADPWAARDTYVDVLLGAMTPGDFAARYVADDPVTAFTLLEAQHHAMLMYTSCGWFFHDLAGLETVQVLRYAARTMDLLADAGESPPETEFLDVLARARSHDQGDGRRVWAGHVVPARVDAPRVAAHLVLTELFELNEVVSECCGFNVEQGEGGRADDLAGHPALAWRRLHLTQRRTGRTHELLALALRLGEAGAAGVVHDVAQPDLGTRRFDLSALLPEAAESLLRQATTELAERLADAAEPALAAAQWATLSHPPGAEDTEPILPQALGALAEAAILHRVERHLAADEHADAVELARRARQVGLNIDSPPESPLGAAVARIVRDRAARAVSEPGEATVDAIAAVNLARELCLHPDLGEAQELVYAAVTEGVRPDLRELGKALWLSPSLFSRPGKGAHRPTPQKTEPKKAASS